MLHLGCYAIKGASAKSGHEVNADTVPGATSISGTCGLPGRGNLYAD